MDSFHVKLAKGVLVITSIVVVAFKFWRHFQKEEIDSEAAQIERLVSAKRSKDDDNRLQIKRQREYRARSPKSEFRYRRVFKRQNTM